MPTTKTSGTQAATIGTEHSLGAEVTDAGTYVLAVDTSNMAAGDVLELRIRVRLKSGGTLLLAYAVSYAHAQAAAAKLSVPVPSMHGLQATLKQTAGTGRSFDWAVLSL